MTSRTARNRRYRQKRAAIWRAQGLTCEGKQYKKFRNVYWCEDLGKYKVAFGVDNKDICVGYFVTLGVALGVAKAYREKLRVKRPGQPRRRAK